MRPDKRIVWRLSDGRVLVTSPAEPLRGVYVVGAARYNSWELKSELLAQFDQLVAAGNAKFEPLESEAAYLARIAAVCRTSGTNVNGQPVCAVPLDAEMAGTPSSAELPARDFREAWTCDGAGRVVIHMPKARAIHLNRIRAKRNKRLEDLDRETMRVITNDVLVLEIEEKKKKLRDLPQVIQADLDAAQTVEALTKIAPVME